MLVIPHRFFDFISPIYDLLIKGSTPSDLLTFLNLQGNEKVLEIGTGTGRTVQKISSLCDQLYLLDPSQLMLNRARKKIPCANFSIGYAEQLPYPNNFFERIFAVDSFHHWNNHREGLAEVYRVLSSDDGIFIVFEFDPKSRFGHFVRSMEMFFRMGSKFFTPSELRVLFEKESFTVTHQQYIDSMTYATIAQKSK
ncbi:class I SAM-dependent methyltransferase [Candidatus Hodarchaeum mangrovi]